MGKANSYVLVEQLE